MNKSYRIGYVFERKVKKFLEDEYGDIVFRQGKSRFPDLIDITTLGEVAFIECKVNGRLSDEEIKRALELTIKTKSLFLIASKNRKLRKNNIILMTIGEYIERYRQDKKDKSKPQKI